jgi:hypothetical protein
MFRVPALKIYNQIESFYIKNLGRKFKKKLGKWNNPVNRQPGFSF